MEHDIKTLIQVLRHHKRTDLADLFRKSRGELKESSTYGSRWFSTLSTYEFYQPLNETTKLKTIKDEDISEIIRALHVIYPIKESAPEINSIDFYVDQGNIFDNELVEVEGLKSVDFDYIQEQIEKCREKIRTEDYEGAVTNSRTLIETICLMIVEKEDTEFKYDGNLIKLHRQVSSILKMNPGDYEDENLKQILSGIFSLVNGVAGLRNTFGDAHGKTPKKRYKIDKRHAILTVNISKTVSEYLYLTWGKS